jgi:hypothetical protein
MKKKIDHNFDFYVLSSMRVFIYKELILRIYILSSLYIKTLMVFKFDNLFRVSLNMIVHLKTLGL